jgi:hypothetical protein
MGLGAVAAATVGASVIGAGASLYGSSQASKSAKDAANLQAQQFGVTRGDLLPYNTTGQNALEGAYNLAAGSRTGGGPDYVSMAQGMMPGQMTQAELEDTPGYRFTRAQGLKAVQGATAARGLGVSGASLKGAGDYATGLADKTYLDQFNIGQQRFGDVLNLNTAQQGNLQAQFKRLSDLSTIGESAAAGTGVAGTSAAATGGNYLNQAGLASAAGTTGVSNAVAGGANNYLAYNALNRYLNPSTTTGYGTSAAGTPGISASGNPVMTGYAPSVTEAQIRAGY